jgi:hypothetical protein
MTPHYGVALLLCTAQYPQCPGPVITMKRIVPLWKVKANMNRKQITSRSTLYATQTTDNNT